MENHSVEFCLVLVIAGRSSVSVRTTPRLHPVFGTSHVNFLFIVDRTTPNVFFKVQFMYKSNINFKIY